MSLKQSTIAETEAYTWQPRPINIWIAGEPYNTLQSYILNHLRTRLEAKGCIFIETPRQNTDLGPIAHLGIAFGKDLDEEISPLERLGKLPKPRGMMLVINTVKEIPAEQNTFDLGRGQIVKKSGHVTVLAEGDPDGEHIDRALWASMPGNNFILAGEQDTVLDGIALRVLAHASANKVNKKMGELPVSYSWEAWCASPVHADIAYAAHAMGTAGIIEDEVPLHHFASSDQVRSVLRFLKRAAMGEGMKSQLDMNLRVMGVTTSGGNKINVSDDPNKGHVIPVSRLSWDGYYHDVPVGCPLVFTPPSVETHENGMVYLASALLAAGKIENFADFLAYLSEHFSEHESIEIVPEGMEPVVTAIDHFHRQPVDGTIKEPERVQIVQPDTVHFPEIDFPCGVREAEYHLLSALFRSSWFLAGEPLDNRMILALLPGHGAVALYQGPRRELTDLLVHGMDMEEIVRI